MQKTKLAFVSLLSFLVVLAPVSSVLARTSPTNEPMKQKTEPKNSQPKDENRGSVFSKIEKQGGDPVSEEKLDEKEGEGLLGGLAASAIGAVVGAVGGGVTYATAHAINGNSMSWRGAAAAIGGGAAGGAATGALAYAAPTP